MKDGETLDVMVELLSENAAEVGEETGLVFEGQASRDNLFVYTVFHSELAVTTVRHNWILGVLVLDISCWGLFFSHSSCLPSSFSCRGRSYLPQRMEVHNF